MSSGSERRRAEFERREALRKQSHEARVERLNERYEARRLEISAQSAVQRSPKKYPTALIFLCLTGLVGGHRYYLGFWRTGVLWTLTLGLFGVGFFCDLFRLTALLERRNGTSELFFS